jgi:hypothetical protein
MRKQPNYDRFLDIHIMHRGHYDFHLDVAPQRDYQRARHGFPQAVNLTRWGRGAALSLDKRVDLGGIDKGYIAVAVELEKIRDASFQEGARDVLGWVGDLQRRGKLRINVHGDGQGNIAMPDDVRPFGKWLSVPAKQIARWLHANQLPIPLNELKKPRKEDPSTPFWGLNTLAMALCMAARHKSEFASLEQGQAGSARAAASSVVLSCIEALRGHGYLEVEVTGSNEIVSTGGEGAGQLGRVIWIPRGWETTRSGSRFEVKIPRELRVNAAKGVIEIPERYEVRSHWNGWLVQAPQGELCFVPTTGWQVDPAPGGHGGGWVIQPPVGWFAVAGHDGGGTFTVELQDTDGVAPTSTEVLTSQGAIKTSVKAVWLRLAHTAEKSRHWS